MCTNGVFVALHKKQGQGDACVVHADEEWGFMSIPFGVFG